MAVIKCKMCGANIEMLSGATYGVCTYCGCTVTFPKISDEQRIAAYDRGNFFRRKGEFDKALMVYEQVVQEEPTDAEAHWCCVLCRYGIEYVQDANGLDWIPTCHRASFDSILEDIDYQYALEYSDGVTRKQYQKEAFRISEIQKRILMTSQNEEKYDVFICYKESDEQGERTQDSVLAQNIFSQLEKEGYRTFFSRITLEDKVGTEFEPYIFAALHSARIMLVIGTKPEYLNSAWVKNEWGRYLALMHQDDSKVLLPCYQDMSPYDLPEALSVLQSYDMSKIGFMQDLVHGINKILHKQQDESKGIRKETVVIQNNALNIEALLKRGFMELEDQNWQEADRFFEQVLNNDAENSDAYLGKFFAARQGNAFEQIIKNSQRENGQYQKKIETLTIKPEEEAERLIADSSIDLQPIHDWISNKLKEIPVSYSSSVGMAEMDLAVLEELRKDKTLSKAIRFGREDNRVNVELSGCKEKLLEQLNTARQAEKSQKEEVRKQYLQRYHAVRQAAEYKKICQECNVENLFFANSESKACQAKQEKKDIERSYQAESIDTLDVLYQNIQNMELSVFDKEAELSNLEEVRNKKSLLMDAKKKEQEKLGQELSQCREKKEPLIQRERELKKQIQQRKATAEAFESIANGVIAFLFFGSIGSGILAIMQIVSCLSPKYIHDIGMAEILMIPLFLILCIVLGFLGYKGHCKMEQMRNPEFLSKELRSVEMQLADIDENIKRLNEKQTMDVERYRKEEDSLEKPNCCLKLCTQEVVRYQPGCLLVYQELDRLNLKFEAFERKELIGAEQNRMLFCYEKREFYPITINNVEKKNGVYELDVTVTNQGLSIKLENFSDKDHFLLLREV